MSMIHSKFAFYSGGHFPYLDETLCWICQTHVKRSQNTSLRRLCSEPSSWLRENQNEDNFF